MWCKRDSNRDPGFRSVDIVWVSFEFWVSFLEFGSLFLVWVSFLFKKNLTKKRGIKETQTKKEIQDCGFLISFGSLFWMLSLFLQIWVSFLSSGLLRFGSLFFPINLTKKRGVKETQTKKETQDFRLFKSFGSLF